MTAERTDRELLLSGCAGFCRAQARSLRAGKEGKEHA